MDSDRDDIFQQNAVRLSWMPKAKLDECIRIQHRTVGRRVRGLGEIAIEQGFIDRAELEQLFDGKRRSKTRQIGGYEILAILGEGGLGTVYQARQLTMKRDIALKVLHSKWLDDNEFRKRFLLEARLVGKMSHQNLIGVFDVGMEGDDLYFSMEFVPGRNVQQMIDSGVEMPLGTAIDNIFTDITGSLEAAPGGTGGS